MRHGFACLLALTIPTFAISETPEAVVKKFVAALNSKKQSAMAVFVKGSQKKLSGWIIDPGLPTFSLRDVSTRINGNRARVQMKLSAEATVERTLSESVLLEKVGAKWLLIPEAGNKGIINFMVQYCVNPAAFVQQKADAKAKACTSNIKQVSIALILVASDHNMVLAVNSSNWRAKIYEFTKNKSLHDCGLTAPAGLAYSLNTALAGKNLDKLAKPTTTVMLYEGKGGKLAFHKDGTAAVGFADGSVRRVTKAEAKKLRWNP